MAPLRQSSRKKSSPAKSNAVKSGGAKAPKAKKTTTNLSTAGGSGPNCSRGSGGGSGRGSGEAVLPPPPTTHHGTQPPMDVADTKSILTNKFGFTNSQYKILYNNGIQLMNDLQEWTTTKFNYLTKIFKEQKDVITPLAYCKLKHAAQMVRCLTACGLPYDHTMFLMTRMKAWLEYQTL